MYCRDVNHIWGWCYLKSSSFWISRTCEHAERKAGNSSLFFTSLFHIYPWKMCFCFLVRHLKLTKMSCGCSFNVFEDVSIFSIRLASSPNFLDLATLPLNDLWTYLTLILCHPGSVNLCHWPILTILPATFEFHLQMLPVMEKWYGKNTVCHLWHKTAKNTTLGSLLNELVASKCFMSSE